MKEITIETLKNALLIVLIYIVLNILKNQSNDINKLLDLERIGVLLAFSLLKACYDYYQKKKSNHNIEKL